MDGRSYFCRESRWHGSSIFVVSAIFYKPLYSAIADSVDYIKQLRCAPAIAGFISGCYHQIIRNGAENPEWKNPNLDSWFQSTLIRTFYQRRLSCWWFSKSGTVLLVNLVYNESTCFQLVSLIVHPWNDYKPFICLLCIILFSTASVLHFRLYFRNLIWITFS